MAEGGEEKDGNLGGLPFERTIRFRKEYSSLIFRQSFRGTMWEELEFCLSVGGSSRKAKFWRGNFYVQVRFDLRLFRELKIECFWEKLGRII